MGSAAGVVVLAAEPDLVAARQNFVLGIIVAVAEVAAGTVAGLVVAAVVETAAAAAAANIAQPPVPELAHLSVGSLEVAESVPELLEPVAAFAVATFAFFW